MNIKKLNQADEIVWDTLFSKESKVELKDGEHHCDWSLENRNPDTNNFVFGEIPSYQHQDLKTVCISKDINQSYYEKGKACGLYGSEVKSKKKYYTDYKYNTKIKLLIEKLHSILF